MKRRKGFYSISVVAKMFEVHQQTIRLYEKEGLITPKRTEGGTRMFSEEDVDKLEEIIHLTHKMGVNIAGVEMVLKLQRKIKRMQEEMNKIFANTQGELEEEATILKKETAQTAATLLEHKKTAIPRLPSNSKETDKKIETSDSDETKNKDWDIEYDDED